MVNGTLDTSLSSQLHISEVQRENRDKHAARYTPEERGIVTRRCAPPAGDRETRISGPGIFDSDLPGDLIREFVRSFPRHPRVRDASTWEGGTANPEATYDIHILGGVCPPGGGRERERRRRGVATDEGRRYRGRCRERASVAEVGGWWWLAERRRQWCRPVARWRQPWYSNPIAEGVGVGVAAAAAAAAAAGTAAAAGADARAGAGNTAGAGVQAKNGDNTKAATARRARGNEVGRGRRADTTLDISYPSARNPLTS